MALAMLLPLFLLLCAKAGQFGGGSAKSFQFERLTLAIFSRGDLAAFPAVAAWRSGRILQASAAQQSAMVDVLAQPSAALLNLRRNV
jgi:hypothetical protein